MHICLSKFMIDPILQPVSDFRPALCNKYVCIGQFYITYISLCIQTVSSIYEVTEDIFDMSNVRIWGMFILLSSVKRLAEGTYACPKYLK